MPPLNPGPGCPDWFPPRHAPWRLGSARIVRPRPPSCAPGAATEEHAVDGSVFEWKCEHVLKFQADLCYTSFLKLSKEQTSEVFLLNFGEIHGINGVVFECRTESIIYQNLMAFDGRLWTTKMSGFKQQGHIIDTFAINGPEWGANPQSDQELFCIWNLYLQALPLKWHHLLVVLAVLGLRSECFFFFCAFSMYWKFSRISRKGVPSDHRQVGSEWLRPFGISLLSLLEYASTCNHHLR